LGWLVSATVFAAVSSIAPAQTEAFQPPEPRLGLVIGNSRYAGALRLDRPDEDADAIKEALEASGFVVERAYNEDRDGIERAAALLRDDLRAAGPRAIGFIYYAGHGGANRSRGSNFIAPIDATPENLGDIERIGVSVDWIMRTLEQAGNRANVLVFDACRTPFGTRGAVPLKTPTGPAPIYGWTDEREAPNMIVALAQKEDQPAADSGAYAEELAAILRKDGLTLEQTFEEVQIEISRRSRGRQIPFVQDGISETICLVSCTRREVDALTTNRALQVLRIAQETRPKGDVGQREALELLVGAGRTFEGFDFDGLSLGDNDLPGFKAPQASFRLGNLARAGLREADLSRVWLSLGNLEDADITQANMTRSVMEFAVARGLVAGSATAPRTTWFGADLQDADFSDAELRGASFVFADLRNADFSGADLSHAFFNGADLRGARFAGARLSNTDVTAAVLDLDQLDDGQRQAICATAPTGGSGYALTVDERFESSRFSSGYEFNDLLQETLWVRNGVERVYPRCVPKDGEDQPRYRPPTYSDAGAAPVWNLGYHLRFERTLVSKAGRRSDVRSRIGGFGNTLKERQALYDDLPQVREYRERLFAELRSSASAPPPSGPIEVRLASKEDLLVLLHKLDPGILEQVPVDWRRQLYRRLQMEKTSVDRQATEQHDDPWGSLFPEAFVMQDADDEAVEIYRRWTEQRARSISTIALAELARTSSRYRGQAVSWAEAIVSRTSRGPMSDVAMRLQLETDHWSPLWTNPRFDQVWVMFSVDKPLAAVLSAQGEDVPAAPVTVRFEVADARYFSAEKVLLLDLVAERLVQPAAPGDAG